MAFNYVGPLFQDHPRRTVMMMPARTRALLEYNLLKLHYGRDWWRRQHERSRHRLQERDAWNCLLKRPGSARQCNAEAKADCDSPFSIHFSSSLFELKFDYTTAEDSAGRIFWLTWKKFCGSYFAFMAARRS